MEFTDDNLTKEQYEQVYLFRKNHIRKLYSRLKKNPPYAVANRFLDVTLEQGNGDWSILDREWEQMIGLEDSDTLEEGDMSFPSVIDKYKKPSMIKRWLN